MPRFIAGLVLMLYALTPGIVAGQVNYDIVYVRAPRAGDAHAAKPFGGIDTPGQGGTISGADSVNFGWALTPQPGMIPVDGSTVTVVIDGVVVGHPTYNQFRSDIANLFPGYANSGGAVGFFHINTTTLANGVHTISWNAFDNLGRGEGLGSRYFNLLTTGRSSLTSPPHSIPPPPYR